MAPRHRHRFRLHQVVEFFIESDEASIAAEVGKSRVFWEELQPVYGFVASDFPESDDQVSASGVGDRAGWFVVFPLE